MYLRHDSMHLTLEVSYPKWPNPTDIPLYWEHNLPALVRFLETAKTRVYGLVLLGAYLSCSAVRLSKSVGRLSLLLVYSSFRSLPCGETLSRCRDPLHMPHTTDGEPVAGAAVTATGPVDGDLHGPAEEQSWTMATDQYGVYHRVLAPGTDWTVGFCWGLVCVSSRFLLSQFEVDETRARPAPVPSSSLLSLLRSYCCV
jgi:hypothetical protein